MRKLSTTLVSILSLCCASATLAQLSVLEPGSGPRRVTIAVVRDGAAPGDDLPARIERELRDLVGGSVDLVFESGPEYDGGWQAEGASAALEGALADRSVDYVLAVGALVSRAAAGLELAKPVVSTHLQRPDLLALHASSEDRSEVQNLSFMVLPLRLETDIAEARKLVPFEGAHLAVSEAYVRQIPELASEISKLESDIGVRIEILPVTDSVAETFDRASGELELVLLGATPRLDRRQRLALIAELTARRIPSYSLVGHPDVEAGVLAARSPDVSRQVVRRAALNLHELMRGTPVEELPVALSTEIALWLNGRTAQALGYAPSRGVRSFATILHHEALRRDERPLDLKGAIVQAEAGSTVLSISEQGIETAFRARQLAKSPLLPQIGARFNATKINSRGLEGLIPDSFGTASIGVSQMIYDDRRVSDYKSASRLWEGSQEASEVERLDVYADAGTAFLALGLVQTQYRIRVANLRITEENLELSRLRQDMGFSGRDEVYRWESELAKRQRELLDVEAQIESRRVSLNQILGAPQNERWQLEEIEVDPAVFPFLGGRLDAKYREGAGAVEFLELMVDYALEQAPELAFLQKSIEAQEIQHEQRQRRWWLPVFQADFQYGYDFYQEPESELIPKDDYRFELSAVYPIFEGNARAEDIRLTQSELEALRLEQELARELVERRTRTALRRVESSFPAIAFAKRAAEKARLNFKVVQEKYAQGLVNVTDLMEANNESFTTEQDAAAAVYGFLLDLIAFQRGISWFQDVKDAAQQEEFLDWVRAGMAGGVE